MAKPITKWVAIDGSEWATVEKATQRDVLVCAIEDAMAPLGKDQTIRAEEYVQHNPDTVLRCRVAILKICASEHPTFEIFRHKPPEAVHPMSIAGRILGDLGGPLNRAWGRFMRIDELGREWEQPYFVRHPDPNAKQIGSVPQ